MTTDEYQKKLDKIISGKKRKRNEIFVFFFWISLILLIVALLSLNVIVFLISLVFLAGYIITYSSFVKDRKLNGYLTEAKQNLASCNFSATVRNLFFAYKTRPDEEIFNMMLDIVNNFNVAPEERSKILSIVIEKDADDLKKDENYQEIVKKLRKISQYFSKSRQIINESEAKIQELKDKIKLVQEENIKTEFQSLIKRYENIIKLENSKINFYNKAQDELIKLRNKHLLNRELIKEKENLMKLEDRLLEKSLSESYSDSIDGFIIYERVFLKALDEYSETLSVSTDQNIFDEVMKEFQNKIKKIN